MAIRDVNTYLVDATEELPKKFIFCRVETDDGTVGWGEAYAIPCRERGIAEFVKGLGDMLSQIFVPGVRPKLNDAGIPELANIYRFFEAFPGHDVVGEFPFFSQTALDNHLVQDHL